MFCLAFCSFLHKEYKKNWVFHSLLLYVLFTIVCIWRYHQNCNWYPRMIVGESTITKEIVLFITTAYNRWHSDIKHFSVQWITKIISPLLFMFYYFISSMLTPDVFCYMHKLIYFRQQQKKIDGVKPEAQIHCRGLY